MLQKLPGFGCGRQRRLRHCLSAPVPCAAQRTGVALSGRRLAGRGAPALGRHLPAAAQVAFRLLPVQVITAPSLRLDTATDRERLTQHRPSSNTPSCSSSILLSGCIGSTRTTPPKSPRCSPTCANSNEQFQVAVLVVHHARKDSQSSRPGQALRGSSELHGWGDSNLYMRRRGSQLTLSTEHRAAPSRDHIPLQLTQSGSALALTVLERLHRPNPTHPPHRSSRCARLWPNSKNRSPFSSCKSSVAFAPPTVCSALAELAAKGEVVRDARGYQLKLPFPVSRPIDPKGNGNGKHPFAPAEDRATLGSDPSADWSPANGKVGRASTGRPVNPLPEQVEKR